MIANVIIPTLGKPQLIDAVESLQHLPFPMRLSIIKGLKWPEAVNKGIGKSDYDVLLMDDDVVLSEDTFKDFERYYQAADIFGFKLLFSDGKIQHAGGFCINNALGHIGYGMTDDGRFDVSYYTCHCTSALLYIKRRVIDKIGIMATDYPGTHFHDVDFSFRAIQAGFKILYIPNPATHNESNTVKDDPEFGVKMSLNYQELMHRFKDQLKGMEKYPERISII